MDPAIMAQLENLEARWSLVVAALEKSVSKMEQMVKLAEALVDELTGLVGHVRAEAQEPAGPMVRLRVDHGDAE